MKKGQTELTPAQDFHMTRIATVVAGMRNRTLEDMRSRVRTGPVAIARQMCYYALRTFTPYSFPDIGFFLRRDHSSVIYGHYLIEANTALAREVARVVKDAGVDSDLVEAAIQYNEYNTETGGAWLERMGLC